MSQAKEDDGLEHAIAYASRRWSITDSKRKASGLECVAINHFRQHRWGTRFALATDCSALTDKAVKSQDLSPRFFRWAARLSEHGT
ncbi:unnamed protein product [Discosporangium mesarthrocarpum]